MEEKYLMRESKPEDIQMITELKAMLTERDQVIKKLIDRIKSHAYRKRPSHKEINCKILGGRNVTMLVTMFASQQSVG